MSIPAFVPEGFLPSGIHPATFGEIGVVFGETNDRRRELFGKLQNLVSQLIAPTKLGIALYVDGSFTTDKASPGDIDAVLEVGRTDLTRFLALPQGIALINTAAIKASFEVHLFIQPHPVPMAVFFQRMRPEEALARRVAPDHPRGILKVSL